MQVAAFRQYSDHHRYTRADLDSLCHQALHLATDGMITTAKDAVKLDDFTRLAVAVWILDIQFQLLAGQEELLKILQQRLSRRR